MVMLWMHTAQFCYNNPSSTGTWVCVEILVKWTDVLVSQPPCYMGGGVSALKPEKPCLVLDIRHTPYITNIMEGNWYCHTYNSLMAEMALQVSDIRLARFCASRTLLVVHSCPVAHTSLSRNAATASSALSVKSTPYTVNLQCYGGKSNRKQHVNELSYFQPRCSTETCIQLHSTPCNIHFLPLALQNSYMGWDEFGKRKMLGYSY